MPQSRVRVEIVNRLGKRVVTVPLRRAVEETLSKHSPCEVCIVLTHDPELKQLNSQHRSVDEATDVLSFPASPNPANHLGDVVISWEFAEAQAKKRKIKPMEEAAMLAVHGTLHLLGMDDLTEPERN
ncbi:MAG: rRNA maturation RNase YbeY, partial [Armatimonadota bacterium]